MKRIIELIISTLLLTCLSACSDDNQDLNRYISDIKQRKGTPVKPIPEFKVPEQFSYPESQKRRSPFKPHKRETATVDNLAPDESRPKQPLENFALDSLKFVGTLDDSRARWGLIQSPNGRVFRVKVGDYIGENYGRIIQLTENELKLEETIKVAGQWDKKIVTLKLK